MITLYREVFNPRQTSYRFDVCVRDGKALVFGTNQPEPIVVKEGDKISISVELANLGPRDIPATAEIKRP